MMSPVLKMVSHVNKHVHMSEDRLESHIIYGLKGKYLLIWKVNLVW